MCYICSCFTNCLDLVQRLITFGLACILCGAVCFGLTVAIVAGIAYGYNYCMAEFITFTRSDVTVYMRRGQFYDKPDLPMPNRRAGEEDLFGLNRTTDYEEPPPAQGKPLSDTWMKSQDTRKYAEKLTKYSPPKFVENPPQRTILEEPIVQPAQVEETYRKMPESPVISIVPNILLSTVSWRSGSSTIVMRKFEPLQEISRPDFGISRATSQDIFPPEPSPKSFGFVGSKHKAKNPEGAKMPVATPQQSIYAPTHLWPTRPRPSKETPSPSPMLPEYVTDEVDEDNIVYKPV